MQNSTTIAKHVRILNVTGLTSYQPLRALVDTALGAKSPPANTFPNTNIIQVALTPSINLLVRDAISQDDMTLLAGVRLVFPVEDVLEKIVVKNAATIALEIYFGEE
jgi:hypothetical protein